MNKIKEGIRKGLFTILSLVMICSMVLATQGNIKVSADDSSDNTVWATYTGSSFDKNTFRFQLNFTIPNGANGEVKIDLATAMIDAMNQYANAAGYNAYPFLPGDANNFDVNITNESGYSYVYQAGSLYSGALQREGDTEAVGFDGQKIPLALTPSRMANSKAMLNLLGHTYKTQVTGLDMINIYTTLQSKEFDSLTAYFLDYYNTKYNSSATTIAELPSAAIHEIMSDGGIGTNGYYNVSYRGSTYEAKLAELNNNAYFNTYAYDVRDNNKTVEFRLKENESQLQAITYNFFYDECYSYGVGVDFTAEQGDVANQLYSENRADQGIRATGYTSVAKLHNHNTVAYVNADAYLASNLKVEAAGSTTFKTALGLDGPLTVNAYQSFSYGFTSNVTLIRNDYKVTTEVVNGNISDDITGLALGSQASVEYEPNDGYVLDYIEVDGEKVDTTNIETAYDFTNINADHHIKVVYKAVEIPHVATYKVDTEVVNGTISESGSDLAAGSNFKVTYEPNDGYALDYIEVDGEKVDTTDVETAYDFTNLSADHQIKVVYKAVEIPHLVTYKVDTEVVNGTISESGSDLAAGSDFQVTYKANDGYELDYIEVDGEKVDSATITSAYEFKNLSANHQIKVVYKKKASTVITKKKTTNTTTSHKVVMKSTSANTGDTTNVTGLIVLVGFALVLMLVMRKRSK